MATTGDVVGADFGSPVNMAQTGEVDTPQETRVDADRLTGIIALGASAVFFAASAINYVSHKHEAAAAYLGLAIFSAAYGVVALLGSRWVRHAGSSNQN